MMGNYHVRAPVKGHDYPKSIFGSHALVHKMIKNEKYLNPYLKVAGLTIEQYIKEIQIGLFLSDALFGKENR